jgi:cell division protein ZapA
MPSQDAPISVSILDREYKVACEPSEREALRAAASLLDERMREIKKAGSLMALERIAVMAALNMADELVKLKSLDQQRRERVDSRIRQLADELEGALGPAMD